MADLKKVCFLQAERQTVSLEKDMHRAVVLSISPPSEALPSREPIRLASQDSMLSLGS